MTFRRIIIRIRITLTILFFLGVLGVVGGAFYLNSTGLNEDIRGHISKELEERGVYISFDSLKYQLTEGLVAKNVQVYDTEKRINKLASIPAVSINLDKTKLLRGIRKINSLSLTNTDLEIPVNPEDPKSPRVVINKINGSIEFPQKDSFSTNDLTANYLGIDISLSGNLWRDRSHETDDEKPDDLAAKQAATYKKVLNYIARWEWPEDSPPHVKIMMEGDINSPHKIKLDFNIDGSGLDYRGYVINDLSATGNLTHNLVTVDKMIFSNKDKQADIKLDYDLTLRDGRFVIDTDFQIQKFVKTFFNRELFKGFNITGGSELKARGYFKLPDNGTYNYFSSMLPDFIQPEAAEFELEATGNAKLTSYEYLGSKFDTFNSDFSWNNGDVYLDRLLVKNEQGYLKGRLLFKNKIITYDTETTLNTETFAPFIKPGGKIDETLQKINFAPDSTLFFKSHGNINASDLTDWVSDGELYLTKINYNGISVDQFNSNFRWMGNSLSGKFTLLDAKQKDFAIKSISSKFLWEDQVVTGNLTLKQAKYKDVTTQQLDSSFQWKDKTITGNLTLKSPKFKAVSAQQLDSSFHWKDKVLNTKINLTKPILKNTAFTSARATVQYKDKQFSASDIIAKHPTGTLSGKLHSSQKYYHFDLVSTINYDVYTPFLINQGLKDFLADFKAGKTSKHYITALGQLNKKDKSDFKSVGKATFNKIIANGVPLDSVKSEYEIDNDGLLLKNSRIVFDYRNYTLHKLFKGTNRGELTASKTYVDNLAKTVTLNKVKGRVFPAPIARIFHKEVADHLEEYQFYEPPTIAASGVFDIIDRPIKDQKLNFVGTITCPNFDTRYKILDGNLLLKNFFAKISIIKNKVNVENIRTQAFGNGIAQGNLYFTSPKTGPVSVEGDMNWKNVDFRQVGITYNFDEIPKGKLRGNIHFSGKGDDISTYNTKPGRLGTFALEDGDLISIPVLGPISSVINPFISPFAGSKALNERLKDISARFRLVNGIIYTDDIQSLTPSLTFFGEGFVNLNNDQIDVTIRVNYRGLLGKGLELGGELIKLPIHILRSVLLNKKPAETGLIQIRGRGHYKDAQWKLVPFDPPRDLNIPLFKPGKAQEIPQALPVQ